MDSSRDYKRFFDLVASLTGSVQSGARDLPGINVQLQAIVNQPNFGRKLQELSQELCELTHDLFPKQGDYLARKLIRLSMPIQLGNNQESAFPSDWRGYIDELKKAIFWYKEVGANLSDICCINPDDLHIVTTSERLFQHIMDNPHPKAKAWFEGNPEDSEKLRDACDGLATMHAMELAFRYGMHHTMIPRLHYVLFRTFLFAIVACGLQLDIQFMSLLFLLTGPSFNNCCIPMGLDKDKRLILLCGVK
ncbi:hypothetical protein HON36_02900 [Candidatus Parcubacteria bacterium]|nr:hypothetical protein [Candidatus Parcubacteria bacterium]MBT7228571.1 hypothetical protein [Candidatus Parcubacteria bacterium]